MVTFTKPFYWRTVGDTAIRWRQLRVLWVQVVFWGTALTVILGLGGLAYHWAISNPEVALVLGLYIVGPLGVLWLAVRLARHAWIGH